MIRTARQLKDLIRNLSRDNRAEAHILMRNYMMERYVHSVTALSVKDIKIGLGYC